MAKHSACTIAQALLCCGEAWEGAVGAYYSLPIAWRLLYNTRTMVHKTRQCIEEGRKSVGVPAAGLVDRALAGFVQNNEPPLGAARDRARDIKAGRELRATRHEEGFYFRQHFLDAGNECARHLNACLRYGFRSTCGLRLNSKKVILHLV